MIRLPSLLAVAVLTLAAVGCTTSAPTTADAAYRQALAAALADGRCTGPAIGEVWAAYDNWYIATGGDVVARSGLEADVLLLQAEVFRARGCDTVARDSYDELLRRFTSDAYAFQRAQALRGLDELPPPFPAPAPTTRVAAVPWR
ncbi:hypothetical protein HL658_20705 [Azospirillum sp. RWY-5-1]|uniref:Lipoprotein n=1 Tax=Azospirillum oleiclasticum TaxID=2735135 RepID=A0ABX2TEH5_9PROT|nr:hypothetical protein [Azospirillum oleiclasticum]NYZ14974.1 hypothetical protein [Azospirillum oleiclasticum]NYZ22736.1 hypothetical protein [Azospirillum oleiclasticum]